MSVFLLAAIARDLGCHVACALIGTNLACATASRSRRFNGYQECGCPSNNKDIILAMIKVESSIFILHSSGMSSSPVWAEGLKKRGTYYEGYVEDLEGTLESHR